MIKRWWIYQLEHFYGVFLTLPGGKGWICLYRSPNIGRFAAVDGYGMCSMQEPICSAAQLVRYKLTPPAMADLPKNIAPPEKQAVTPDVIPDFRFQTRDMLFELELRDTTIGVDLVAREHCAGKTETAWGDLDVCEIRAMRDWLNNWLERHDKDE